MNSSDTNSAVSTVIIPEFVVMPLPDLPKAVEQFFPSIAHRDRDELVRQVFDHLLETNALDPHARFVPLWHMLDLDHYRIAGTSVERDALDALAQNIYSMIFLKLVHLGFDKLVELQEGFHYTLAEIRPNGYQIVLKCLHPSIQSSYPRYDPAHYT